MGKILSFILAALTVCVAITSCNTNGCLDNQNSVPLAGFYSSEGNAISISALDIYGVGAPNDSLLLSSNQSASQVYLQFRPAYYNVSFCIHYTDEDINYDEFNDTIKFTYTSIPYFASEECGAMYYYKVSNIQHTSHLVDSVVMDNPLVTNTEIENIRIYFRTE
jgi:hypothetical protein